MRRRFGEPESDKPYRFPASRTADGFQIDGFGGTPYLVGADGPKSRVARDLGLGENRQFLFGV
jgi:hypothetical protein